MPGIQYKFQHGPTTHQAAAPIVGGQVVVPDPTDDTLIRPAGAGATNVIGVALNDALPAGSDDDLVYSTVRPDVALANSPMVVPVVFAAAATYGDHVVAADAGQVTPATAAVDSRLIIGKVVDKGDVPANGVAHIRLNV